jgi:hypothetical protein
MKSLFLVAASAIIAGCVGVAWNDARLARAAESAFVTVAQNQARTRTEIQRAGERLAAAEKERATPRFVLDSLQKARSPAVTAAEPQKTASATTQLSEYLLNLEDQKDPKVQVVLLASLRARLVTSYALLFRMLGLSPVQIEKFQDIAVQREEQNLDLNAILSAEASANTILSSDTWNAVTKLKAQAETDYQVAQRELLGAAGFQQFQEYERTSAVRNIASGLAGAAVMAGIPFTAQQTERLTQVLANASDSYQSGGLASKETVDWGLVDTQAQQILSESQWILVKTVEPPGGGRFGSQYSNAVNQASKADSESRRAAASKQPGG